MEQGSLRADANISVRPAGIDRARHQDRAQEHEQLHVPGARDQRGDRAPDRAAAKTAARSPRRRCTTSPPPGRSPRCAPRKRRTTTATSRSRTWCRSCPTAPGSRTFAPGLPELPVDRRERWIREFGLTFEDAEVLSEPTELGDYFERVAALAPPEVGGQLGARRPAGAAARARPGAVGERGEPRGAGRDHRAGRIPGDLDAERQGGLGARHRPRRCAARGRRRARARGDPGRVER